VYHCENRNLYEDHTEVLSDLNAFQKDERFQERLRKEHPLGGLRTH
jgi:hypothetical protein